MGDTFLHYTIEETNCDGEVIYLGIEEDDEYVHSCLECHKELKLKDILQDDLVGCEE